MDVHDWSRLPPEVLVQIFNHIPSSDLVVNIPLVCWAWKDTQQHLLQQLSFWWKKLEHEGILISRDHRFDLINNVEKPKLVKMLQATSVPDITFKRKRYSTEKEVLGDKDWNILSTKLISLRASVYLMYRKPKHVDMLFGTAVSGIKDLDTFFLQLSHTNCAISFEDEHSYRFKSSFAADAILRHMNRDNAKCRITHFYGYVRSINSLPSSIKHLCLAIQCCKKGKAIDPGISMLQQQLPKLSRLSLSVRPGTNLSHIQISPHWNIEMIYD